MVAERIKEIVGDIDEGEIVLLDVPSDDIHGINRDVISHCSVEHNATTVYITITRPSEVVMAELEEAGANIEDVFFVDCATDLTGGDKEESDRAIYLNPQDLTGISIAMEEAIDQLPKNRPRILVFDSLSTLRVFNEADTVSQFAHQMSGKMREWDIKSLVFTVSSEMDDSIRDQLVQFSDRIVDFE